MLKKYEMLLNEIVPREFNFFNIKKEKRHKEHKEIKTRLKILFCVLNSIYSIVHEVWNFHSQGLLLHLFGI